MEQFVKSVNKFLSFNDFRVLENKGSVSSKQAVKKAYKEYEIFNKTQKIESDFDIASRKYLKTCRSSKNK